MYAIVNTLFQKCCVQKQLGQHISQRLRILQTWCAAAVVVEKDRETANTGGAAGVTVEAKKGRILVRHSFTQKFRTSIPGRSELNAQPG